MPAAVAAINAQLMARETTWHLAGSAQEISRELIERAIAELGG
ncbi:hypothetical protein [Novosphingobium malaysiense]|nr:hypothetical protein [Novosphingobium malaysiense]